MFRKFAYRFTAVAALVVVAGFGGIGWLRTSLPQMTGSVTLAGLDKPVEVVRDANAVPHIFAKNPGDAYFALATPALRDDDRLPDHSRIGCRQQPKSDLLEQSGHGDCWCIARRRAMIPAR